MSSTQNSLELEVTPRTLIKNSVRKFKKQKRVAAVAYGSKINNLYFTLKQNDAIKYSKSAFKNKIFTLKSENKDINGLKVLKKDVSYDKLTRNPIHIDFFALDMAQIVRVTVKIEFKGKPKGVKEEGGVFSSVRRDLEVECLPHEIPTPFQIDVSELRLNQSYHISDIKIPENIKLITRSEETICLVSEAQEEIVQQSASASSPAEGETSKEADASTEKKSTDEASSKNKAKDKTQDKTKAKDKDKAKAKDKDKAKNK